MAFRAHNPSFILLVTIAVCGLGRGDSKDLSIRTAPVFASLSAAQGVLPLSVEVTNSGASTSGVVTVTIETTTITHPIELPRGSKKQFITYIPNAMFYEAHIRLDTTEGEAFTVISSPEPRGVYACGLIGGSVGDMTFLRVTSDDREYVELSDAYAKPGLMPDRVAGYESFKGLVLGDGAERMTDDEVNAVKTWVISGGTLIFIGGSNTTVIEDERWKGFLPIQSFTRRNVESLASLRLMGGSEPPAGNISLAVGKPTLGAFIEHEAQGMPLVVSRRAGFGQTTYLAFDPFEAPIRQWKGNAKLFRRLVNQERWFPAESWLGDQIRPNYEQSSWHPAGTMGAPTPIEESSSPFSARLPVPGTVLLILFLHLIIAVPVNFYLMRKIGRSELAWVTTPLISVGFAAVFFSFAAGLYQSGQSTRSKGVLFASAMHPEGYFMGATELFIPRGGTYDLKLNGVEIIEDASSDYMRPGDLRTVDDGKLRIPNFTVSNLAFKEFSLQERVAAANWVDVRVKKTSAESILCKVTNRTPYDLTMASVHWGKRSYTFGDVPSGESIEKTVTSRPAATTPWSGENEVVLDSVITGFRPGPQVGSDSGSNIRFIYFGGPVG